MTPDQLTEMLYRFVARIDDDPWIQDKRLKEHAHLLREEIRAAHPNADDAFLPKVAQR